MYVIFFIFSNVTDQKQLSVAAEEEQKEPEAEQQGSPEEDSMETNTVNDADQDQEAMQREKRKEAKVCAAFTVQIPSSLKTGGSCGVVVRQRSPVCMAVAE